MDTRPFPAGRAVSVLLLLIALSTPARAAQLQGRVLDASGGPLAEATVALADLGREVRTDAGGAFAFEDLPDGPQRLLVYRLGYAYLTEEIALPAALPLELRLRPSPYALPPVIVTATRQASPVLHSPLPGSFLGGEALRHGTDISLAHALEALPGLRSVTTGGQIGKPMVRGLTGARVLVLDDGHRLEDYSWSDEDGPAIDPVLSERVEVLRGPASVLYGPDALAGVANALPPPLLEAAPGVTLTRGRVAGYFGSNSREGGGLLSLAGARGRLGWRLGGAGRFAEALHTPDGEIEHTGFAAVTGEAALGYRGERSSVAVRYARYGGEFKLLEAGGPPPGEVEGEGEEEEGPERKSADDRVQIDAELLRAKGLRLESTLQWQRHSLIELSDEALPIEGVREKKESEAFNLLLDTVTLDLLAHHRTGERLRGTVGLSGSRQTNDTRGPIPLVPDAEAWSAGVFVFEQLRLGAWDLLGGLRGDAKALTAQANETLGLAVDDERDWQQLAGDLGCVLHPMAPLALSVNAGLAWRAPSLFELYADGPQIAEARYLAGQAALDAERALDLDGGLRWEGQRLRAEVAVFWNRIDDFVGLYPQPDSLQGLQVWEYHATEATLSGFELGARAQLGTHYGLSGGLDAVQGRDETADDALPLIPPLRGRLGVDGEWWQVAGAERLQAALSLELVARKDRLAPHETESAGYGLLGGELGLERLHLGRDWDLRLRVRNALNRRYRDFLSRYKAFADNPGVDVTLRVETRF